MDELKPENLALVERDGRVVAGKQRTGHVMALGVLDALLDAARAEGRQSRLDREDEARRADELHDVVCALHKAWPDAEDIAADWPRGIIGRIEDLIRERDEALLPGSSQTEDVRELGITREWFERKVPLEDGCDIGAGLRTEGPERVAEVKWMVRALEAEEALKRARLGLSLAGDTFREYAALHRAKGTRDGEEKATRNEQMAAACDRAAIAKAQA